MHEKLNIRGEGEEQARPYNTTGHLTDESAPNDSLAPASQGPGGFTQEAQYDGRSEHSMMRADEQELSFMEVQDEPERIKKEREEYREYLNSLSVEELDRYCRELYGPGGPEEEKDDIERIVETGASGADPATVVEK